MEDNLYAKSTLDASASNLDANVADAIGYMSDIGDKSDILSDASECSQLTQFKLLATVKFCLVTCSKLVDCESMKSPLNQSGTLQFFITFLFLINPAHIIMCSIAR